VDAYFGNNFPNGLAVTEIAVFGRADAMDDSGTTCFVFHTRKPGVEFFGAFKQVHAL
jgi:hypothetical protein